LIARKSDFNEDFNVDKVFYSHSKMNALKAAFNAKLGMGLLGSKRRGKINLLPMVPLD
jgi:hypothetical protein